MCTKPQEEESILSFCEELTPMQNQRADNFNWAKRLLYGNSAREQQKKNQTSSVFNITEEMHLSLLGE